MTVTATTVRLGVGPAAPAGVSTLEADVFHPDGRTLGHDPLVLDITGDPRMIPAELPGSDDITLFVLGGSGHNHNVDANRTRLWDRIAGWVQCPA